MGGCSAFNCSNRSNNNLKLFRFPREEERRKKWAINCRRKDWVPGPSAQLCEIHFEESQFESKRDDGWKKLRPNAIPTLFDFTNPPKQLAPRRPKRIGSIKPGSLLDSEPSCQIDAHFEKDQFEKNVPDKLKPNAVPSIPSHRPEQQRKNSQTKLVPRKVQIVQLYPLHNYSRNNPRVLQVAHPVPLVATSTTPTQDINLQIDSTSTPHPSQEDFNRIKRNLQSVKRKLTLALKEKETLKKKMASLFNPDQIQFLERETNVKEHWSEDTIKKALELQLACGSRGYSTLLSQGFPFPSERTLQRKIENTSVKKELSISDVEATLSSDDMAIQPSLDNDAESNTILGLPSFLDDRNKECDTQATRSMTNIDLAEYRNL